MLVVTEAESDEWRTELSYIDEKILKRYVTEISKPVYYLSGPAGMVKDMYKMLVNVGANEDHIKTEGLSGY
ncbi:hypothetical protein ABNN70_15250 [Sporolactobacillus sp. Y61]|uniref:Oxidoreductase FAD/NAD(P)-binding domain-containing protein n=1 Tax=Sporolactobacillus sp. Y61 TaxID=3160863 RepID=A0AAU8IFC7_9BACL